MVCQFLKRRRRRQLYRSEEKGRWICHGSAHGTMYFSELDEHKNRPITNAFLQIGLHFLQWNMTIWYSKHIFLIVRGLKKYIFNAFNLTPLLYRYILLSVLFQTKSCLVCKSYTLKMRRIFQTNSSLVWIEKNWFCKTQIPNPIQIG